MIFLIFSVFFVFFDFFVKNEKEFKESPIIAGVQRGGEVGSASPPGGNLVDGLPPASSTETVAKRGRRGGCTTMRRAMKK